MKKLSSLLALASVVVFGIFVLAACGGSDDTPPAPTAEEIQIEKMAGSGSITWIPGEITRDGDPVKDDDPFNSAFSLTITTGKTYNASNGGDIIPSSGTWDFVGTNLNEIERNDGIKMTVTTSTGSTSLRLAFTLNEDGSANGRTEGVAGSWVFDLVPQ